MSAGLKEATITYQENENYTEANATVIFTVNKTSTPVVIEPVENANFGDDVTVNVTVENATGKVTFIVDGVKETKDLNDGNVSYTIEDIAAGNHTVIVIYEGDDNHTITYAMYNFTIDKKESLIKEAVANPVIEGQTSVINVAMNSTESGSVIIEINGMNVTVPINNGNATFEIVLSENATGKVYYLGDDKFNAAAPVEFTAVVNPKADSIVTITTDSLTICESATIEALLNGAASDDIIYIINGVETNVIGQVVAGTYNVVAVFEGNATHKANSTNKTFTIEKLDVPITISVDESYNVTDTVNIAVTAINGTNITINGEAFDASKTSYAAGTYTITAVFEGNATHNANILTQLLLYLKVMLLTTLTVQPRHSLLIS